MATKSYPAKVVLNLLIWGDGPSDELCLEGMGGNKNWCGCVINEYVFNRLEKKKYKETMVSKILNKLNLYDTICW